MQEPDGRGGEMLRKLSEIEIAYIQVKLDSKAQAVKRPNKAKYRHVCASEVKVVARAGRKRESG